MNTRMHFANGVVPVVLPDQTDVLRLPGQSAAAAPEMLIRKALENPAGSPALSEIVRDTMLSGKSPRVVIVVSDNTRPVPYKGSSGILAPLIDTLLAAGIRAKHITLLVATGTHAPMDDNALRRMLGDQVFEAGISVRNHDCTDASDLIHLGRSSRGNMVYVNRTYMEADIKILTGLVESHFMAGASGGRKAICPGIIGEQSTFVFHGAAILSHCNARDLVLDGNPVHEEALEIAGMAGADFTVNVTLNRRHEMTGVFAGGLDTAHRQAVETLRKHVEIPIHRTYDIVVTHGGYVGVNHYQCAKAAVAAIPALQSDSILFMTASTTDVEPVGSVRYKKVLALLKETGAAGFSRKILDASWDFVPEQWQVQMWAKVFQIIPTSNFYFFSPYLTQDNWADLPGNNAADLVTALPPAANPENRISAVTQHVVTCLIDRFRSAHGRNPSIAFLADGPYGVLKRTF